MKAFFKRHALEAVIIGVCLLAIAGLALAAHAEAPTVQETAATYPTNDQLAQTYALVYGLVAYRYGLPRLGTFDAPKIRMVPPDEMCKALELKDPCGIGGITFGDVIFLRDDADYRRPETMTVVAHEFVHYFQWIRTGKHVTTLVCEKLRDEYDAYSVQMGIAVKADIAGWAIAQIRKLQRAYYAELVKNDCTI